jgi:hypothetical protein
MGTLYVENVPDDLYQRSASVLVPSAVPSLLKVIQLLQRVRRYVGSAGA